MAKNPHGGLRGNTEWGGLRKGEDRDRNLANRARREAISEQVREFQERWERLPDYNPDDVEPGTIG